MKERYVHRHILQILVGVCFLTGLLFLLVGCGMGSVFDGSRVSNASEFQMEYFVLNREETAELELKAGDRLEVTLSHTKGYVDVTVGLCGKDPIYRGNGQENAGFVLEIAETGNYHISVSGHQAKGNVSFTRIPGGQE